MTDRFNLFCRCNRPRDKHWLCFLFISLQFQFVFCNAFHKQLVVNFSLWSFPEINNFSKSHSVHSFRSWYFVPSPHGSFMLHTWKYILISTEKDKFPCRYRAVPLSCGTNLSFPPFIIIKMCTTMITFLFCDIQTLPINQNTSQFHGIHIKK